MGKANNRKKVKEQGYFGAPELVVSIVVLGVLMVGGGMAYSGIVRNFEASAENYQCNNSIELTNDLVAYIEEYNVNNPTNKLGDFEILDSETYESETHPELINDSKFSLLVSKATCNPYKLDTLAGGHFIIKRGESSVSAKSNHDAWAKVYDSREAQNTN